LPRPEPLAYTGAACAAARRTPLGPRMLSFFRRLAKSRIFLGTVGVLLLLSLAIFGDVRSAFRSITAPNAVVAVGGRTIDPAEFSNLFKRQLDDLSQQNSRTVTADEAAKAGLVERMLSMLSVRESLFLALERAGIRPSDKLVAQEIAKIPAFQNPVTGRFDRDTYVQALRAQQLVDTTFEKAERDQVRLDHYRYALAGGLKAPRIFGILEATAQLQSRTYSYFFFDPRTVPTPKPPTDAQLETFIKANADALKSPEFRSLTVVRFSARQVEPQVTVDPAEVRRRYDFRKDTLSTPEKRTVVQITAPNAQAAQGAAARLAKGEDPAAVAKSLGVEPVRYADAPRTAIVDPAIAQAAFNLAAGGVSPPVQGRLGVAVVKVLSITPGKVVSFEEARPALEAELRTKAAQERIYDLVDKYQDAHGGGASLKEAAAAAGVTALDLPPVTAQGADERGQPQPLLSRKLVDAAFKLPEGGESDVEKEADGEYYAVRVNKVLPPVLPTVAKDRERLTAFYLRQEGMKAVQARLDALVARLNKGERIDAVAASVGASVVRETTDIQAASAERSEKRRLYSFVFTGKPGAAGAVGTAIARIDAVQPGPPERVALMGAGGEQPVRMQLFNAMTEDAARWAGRVNKVKTNPALARQALGLAPEDTKDAAAK
jgi:peptidyl-prolyl cis-trans isomerase D